MTSIIQTHSDAASRLFNSQALLWLSACSYNVHRILARYDQSCEVLVLYLDRPGSKPVAAQLCAGDSDTAT
jgi:hypothetical protein